MSEILLNAVFDAIFAAIAGFGFAYVSSPPQKTLIYSAIIAAIAHASRFFLIQSGFLDISAATLVVSFIAGILGMFFARRLKVPAEIIAFPALLPMIPGIYAYKSVLALFMFIKNEDIAQKSEYLIVFFDNALTTASVMIALGVGVSVTLLLFYEESLMCTRGARSTKKEQK